MFALLTSKEKTARRHQVKIKLNSRAYTDMAEIADQFNKHFVNVGQNLAKKIENCQGRPTQFIRSTPVASFVMSCVTVTQVCLLFKCLNDQFFTRMNYIKKLFTNS